MQKEKVTMDTACLQYLLTNDEKRQFNEEGYLVVEDALAPDQVTHLTALSDSIHARKVAEGFDPKKALFYPNFIPDDPAFAALVDYPKTLPKVWGLLGWNIYLYHAHLIVTPPSGETPSDRTFGWHQDSGRVNVEIECHPRPRLSLKVAYFLSDVSEPGRGNFWILPGSHLCDTLDLPADRVGQPEGAIPVCVKPGTAVFFDRRLWHTASPNWSDITRKVLFYGYGYRWIRTKDDMTVQSLWESSDPIRRQLLGDGVNANGHYTPTDDDVPLRLWLREHAPQDAN
jgi:ectoine hydroxylase